MSKLTTAQRMKMPPSDFGDPKRRLFPVVDQSDVDAAAHLIGRAADPEAVKKRVIAIARRKGLTLPDAWQADITEGKRRIGDALGLVTRRAFGHGAA